VEKRLKLLQIIGSSGSGGAETFYTRFVRALRPFCDVIPVVRTGSWVATQLDRAGTDFVCVRFGGYLDWKTRARLSRLIADEQPDIAQTWMSRASRHMPRDTTVKWVGRLGGYYNLKYYDGADCLVGNTDDICRYIRTHGWAEDRVRYLPNFTSVAPSAISESKAAIRAKFGIPQDATVLFSAGRFHENKGYDLALEALERLPASFHYLLIGDGVEAERLSAWANAEILRERVHIFGWADDITRYAKAADIWLVPSRIEPFGNVVLESWAYGVPVIASDTIGPKALIADGDTGLLFRNGDVESLVMATRRLADDTATKKSSVENGKRRLSDDFSEEFVIQRWIKFYEGLATPV